MQQVLDIYSDYLLALFSYTRATGLSRLTKEETSRDQVSRFLSSEMKTSNDLWQIDDSIEEKPFWDENYTICWH